MSKTSKKSEIMENQVISETLAPTQEIANTPETPIVSEPLTMEQLTEKVKTAKIELAELNAKYDYDETNAEIIAKEKQISEILAERKLLAKQLEKTKLERQHAETLENSKKVLNDIWGISENGINELLADNDDAKKSLKELIFAFNFIFGKQPLIVKENVTGTQLAKSSAKTNGGTNITQSVRDMLTAGNDNDTIVNFLLNNGFDDEKVAKKRLTDIRWKWEIDNGLRVKK
jgi:hypothetical protein